MVQVPLLEEGSTLSDSSNSVIGRLGGGEIGSLFIRLSTSSSDALGLRGLL